MRFSPFSNALLLQCWAWFSSSLKVSPSAGSGQPAELGAYPTKQELLSESQKIVDAITRLWDGEELDPNESQSLHDHLTPRRANDQLALRHANTSRVKGGSWRLKNRKLAMLGTFDAGTNLLMDTLTLNYPDLVYEACGLGNDVRGRNLEDCRVWKHGLGLSKKFVVPGELPLETVLSGMNVKSKEVVLMILVRNPLSQLASWKKAYYDLRPCVDRPFASFDTPCTARGVTWKMSGWKDGGSPTTFASSMDIYNRNLYMYKQLQESGRFRDVVFITYEDLVLSPEDVLTDLAASLGWPLLKEVKIRDVPAKGHGHPVGRSAALENLQQRVWLSGYSREERELVCRGLDPQAYGGFQENGVQVPGYPVVAYGADCSGYNTH